MTDQPKPPVGLVDRLRHFERNQIESGDEYGAEVLHRAAEEITRLTRERDEARAAEARARELERVIVERHPVWYAYVEMARRHDQELQACIKERDSLLSEVATGGPDMPAWDEGEGEEPGRRAAVFGLISAERERQASLWGPGPMPQGRELAILMEEVGEVARALQGEGDLRDELVQVAAVCVRWLEAEGER